MLDENHEVEKEKPIVTLSVFGDSPKKFLKNLIDVKRFSSLQKLLRVTAYVKRFVDATTGKGRKIGEITSEEKERVLKMWIMSEQDDISRQKKFGNVQKQLSLFGDDNGIFRLKGRLEDS